MEIKQWGEEEMVEADTWSPNEQKWRGINDGAACDTRNEEKMTQIWNPSLGIPQISPKISSISSKYTKIYFTT